MRPIVIWDVSDYDQTILMLYHVYSKKKSDTFETIKKICGKRHAWTELPFAEVFPPNTSFYRADEACPRWDCRRIYQVFLQKWDQVLKLQTDPHFHWHDEVHFHLLLTAGKKMCRPVILWFCLWSMPNWESLNKAVLLSKTRWLHVWSCDKLHSLTATHM